MFLLTRCWNAGQQEAPESAGWSPSCPHTPPSLQMAVIGQQAGSSSNLTELQVVNLDATHSTKSE